MRLVETILKDTALATQGVLHYGRGAKAYANIESNAYPRVWVHAVNPIDEVHINNLITVQYEIIAEVSNLIDYTADVANENNSTTIYLETLYALEQMYLLFIGNLNKHPNNKRAIGKVTRRELLHEYDDNVVGYVFTFVLNVNESIPHQCP